jgi:hypothetical protein
MPTASCAARRVHKMRSCSLPVLIHEPTEQVASVDPDWLIIAG